MGKDGQAANVRLCSHLNQQLGQASTPQPSGPYDPATARPQIGAQGFATDLSQGRSTMQTTQPYSQTWVGPSYGIGGARDGGGRTTLKALLNSSLDHHTPPFGGHTLYERASSGNFATITNSQGLNGTATAGKLKEKLAVDLASAKLRQDYSIRVHNLAAARASPGRASPQPGASDGDILAPVP